MTEKKEIVYPERSVPAPAGLPALGEGTKWAVLIYEGRKYRLREKNLTGPDARKLTEGKYLGRDIILTVSSGDLSGRIESLNLSLL